MEETVKFVMKFETYEEAYFDYVISNKEYEYDTFGDLSDARRKIISLQEYNEKNGRWTVYDGNYAIFIDSIECFKRTELSIDNLFRKG